MDKLYTVFEVAKILRLKPRTVREYLRTGKMGGYKAGKDWRVTRENIEEYLESNKRDKTN